MLLLSSVMMSRHQHIVTGYIMEVLDLYEVEKGENSTTDNSIPEFIAKLRSFRVTSGHVTCVG